MNSIITPFAEVFMSQVKNDNKNDCNAVMWAQLEPKLLKYFWIRTIKWAVALYFTVQCLQFVYFSSYSLYIEPFWTPESNVEHGSFNFTSVEWNIFRRDKYPRQGGISDSIQHYRNHEFKNRYKDLYVDKRERNEIVFHFSATKKKPNKQIEKKRKEMNGTTVLS